MKKVRILENGFKKALVLENPSKELDKRLRAQGIEPQRMPESATLDRAQIIATLKEGQHDLLYKRSRFIVDDEVLSASNNLAAIMLCCIGDDSVDKQKCAEHGILVMNDPVSNARSVVEMVFGEMICMARRIFHAVERTQVSEWTKDNRARYEIKGKTLSIIGLGNIGKQVAQMAEMFEMDVCFYDSREVAVEVGKALGWEACETIEQAFRKGDFVSVHVSAENQNGETNKGLFTYEDFRQIGADRGENSPRIFLNASRGFLFDPADLTKAVKDGFVNYASIDVFPEEPGSKTDIWKNPYSEMAEIIGTPHIGAATQEAQPRIASFVAGTTKKFNTYGTIRDCVFSPGRSIGVDASNPKFILSVVHSDKRGTKKAVSDCIFDAGISSIQSSHIDFPKYGIAYEINAIDRPLTREQLEQLVANAIEISGDPTAIRSIRQIDVSSI